MLTKDDKELEEIQENEVENEELEEFEDEEYEEEDDEDIECVETETGSYPVVLNDLQLECIYLGLLFNNPKAISKYYFEYDCCHFSDNELLNLYKIILFRDGDVFASAVAKEGFKLPKETTKTYDLRIQAKKIALQEDYSLELVYTELRKLFLLKKHFLKAPTFSLQKKILEILKYTHYDDMSAEEVESAIEQIGVTNKLSQAVLNKNVTKFLLSGENNLRQGLPIQFPILSKVFKGFRRGEMMSYAMPSNAGKSRFTVKLASYLSLINKKKVLIISNEMSEEKMRLCLITTIINDPEMKKLYKKDLKVNESEILDFKFKATDPKKTKVDENGYVLKEKNEKSKDFAKRLVEESQDFKDLLEITDWVSEQIENSMYFIHITEHSNDDLKKIILNYYYKEGIEYIFYDTLKTDTDNIGNGEELKRTATILSNIAQKYKIFIGTSLQLLESNTLPVNLTINDLSVSKTIKEVLDILCLMKQISKQTLHKYEYSDTDTFDKCYDLEISKDVDIRYYVCVVDKNRAGAKPTVLFKLNLAYNTWEELGYVRLKQTDEESV